MGDKLTDLVNQGISKKYELKALVLERFADITAARQNLRTWAEIAAALGLPKNRGKDMSPCYLRVSKGIAKGNLKPGKTTVTKVVHAAEQADTPATPPAKRPLPGQIPVGDGDAMTAALEEKLGANFFK